MERSLPRPAPQIWRAALLATTGLSALVIAAPVARAQTTLPADTTPQGGQVAAGSASITQGNAATTINQTSARTVINWQSFNVGSAASVQFNQPSSSAIALNRVMTPAPSLIAGQINANGQLVLINQSGVVFAKGSEVNAESLVVATSNIADKDFMAGNMVFSGAPNPGAKIINDGNITVKDTGLAGFVAPQVVNDGVITAKLGQVVLAGASAFTLDLYGDRLMSIDVTKAVRAVDVGGQVVAALVTNRGLILANGGTITLTARDADALVTQLVDAGGTIQANTVGAQAGAIHLSGVGGDISIAGNLLARGANAGEKGGAIEALTTGTVGVGAAAVVDASGAAGGGVVALGTDLTRAAQGPGDTAAPVSAAVRVAPGARIASNATDAGDGGHITILSAQDTDVAGDISATGGTAGGNGGFVEISGESGYALTGTVNVAAPAGAAGTILIDPASLTIATGGGTPLTLSGADGSLVGSTGAATIAAGEFDSLTGNVELLATTNLAVDEAVISKSLASLLLMSPIVTSDAVGTISLSGTDARLSIVADTLSLGDGISAPTIELAPYTSGTAETMTSGEAGDITASSLLRLGAYTPYAPVTVATPPVTVTAGTLELAPGGMLTVTSALELDSTGSIAQAAGGLAIKAETLALGSGTGVTLANPDNAFSSLVSSTTTDGLDIVDEGDIAIFGPIRDRASINLSGADLTNFGSLIAPAISLAATGGTIGNFSLISASNFITLDSGGQFYFPTGTVTAPIVSLATGPLDIGGTLDASNLLALAVTGTVAESGNGTVDAGTLATSTPLTGGLTLTGANNVIGTLDAAADGLVDILDQSPTVVIQGSLTGASVLLAAPQINLLGVHATIASSSTAGGTVALGANIYSISSDAAILAPLGTIEIDVFSPGALVLSQFLIDPLDPTAKELILGSGATGAQASGIDLPNSVSFSGSTLVDLSASGPILQTMGTAATATISAGALEFDAGSFFQAPSSAIIATLFAGDGGPINGDVVLAGTANAIGTLGAMDLGANTLSLMDDANLTVNGPVSAGAITLDETHDALLLDGNLTATGVIDLTAVDIYQDEFGGTAPYTGSLTAGTLTGSAGDDAQFGDQYNNVQTLGNFTVAYASPTGGDFELSQLASAVPLTIAGKLIATTAEFFVPTVSLTGGISVSSDLTMYSPASFALVGGIDAGHQVALQSSASGSITGTGSISTDLLTSGGYRTDEFSLTGTNNHIATLTGIVAVSSVDITNASALTVAGNGVTAYGPLSGGAGNITLAAPTLSLQGLVKATTYNGTELDGTAALAADLLAFGTGGSVSGGTIELGPYSAGETLEFGTMSNAVGTASIPATDLTSLTTANLEIGSAAGREAARLITGGSLSFPGTLSLEATGGVSQSGSLYAASLLISGASLALAGSLGAGPLELDAAGAVTDAGTLNATTISLQDGSFLQAPGAAPITATVLQGNLATGGNFASLGNSISELGPLFVSSGSLDLGDAVSLAVVNSLAATGITLTDTGAGISLASGAYLAALSAGTIVLTTDTLTAAPGSGLSGELGILEPYSTNSIDLGGTSAGTLNLAQTIFTAAAGLTTLQIGTGAAPISLDMPITASSGTLLLDGESIVLNSLLSATGAIALQSPLGVSESSAGSISAPAVVGIGTFGNILLTNNFNTIASLGNFTIVPGGTLALDNTGMLTVPGTIMAPDANQVSLTSGEIFIPGTIAGPDLVYLGADDSIGISGLIQTGELALGLATGQASEGNHAVIGAGTLAADGFSGNLLFGAAFNDIGTLAGFSATQFLLDDNSPLDISAPLTAVNATIAAAALTLSAPVSVSNALAIDSYAGGITQAAGISATTLTSDGSIAGGNVVLTNALNTISTLGRFALQSGGSLALNDTAPLSLAAVLTAGTASLDAPSIAIPGSLVIGAQLTLASAGTIAETGFGLINVPTLTDGPGTVGGDLDLGSNNQIVTLGNFAVNNNAGTLNVVDAGALDVAGSITALAATLSAASIDLTGTLLTTDAAQLTSIEGGTDISGQASAGTSIGIGSAQGIGISGQVTADSELALISEDGVVESPAAIIVTPLLTGANTTDNVTLGSDANAIGTLGNYAFGPDYLGLRDASSLVLAGIISGGSAAFSAFDMFEAPTATLITPGGLTLDGQEEDGSYLELDGTIYDGANLSLQNFETIAEPTGTIVANELDSGSGTDGMVDLNNGEPIQNFIGTLGHFFADSITLVNQQLPDLEPLTVTGSLAVDTALVLASGIEFDGFVSATSLLELSSLQPVTQSGGTIATGQLESVYYYIDDALEDANGDTALDQPGNAIQNLGPYGVVAGSNLSVVNKNTAPLTVDGALTANAISLTADGITFDSDADADQITLASPAGVTQLAGSIITNTLSTGPGGVTLATVLDDGSNTINTLASYADTGDLTLGTSGTLEITGSVSAATLELNTGGDVNEIGAGQVTATVLTTGIGGIDGAATLDNTLNQIGTLGDYNGDGDLRINDTLALDIDGLIDLSATPVVTSPGGDCEEEGGCAVIARPDIGITVGGGDDATGTLGVADAVSVTQTGGSIIAGALTSNGGSVTGAAQFLQPGNAIYAIGPFSAGGDISLNDTVPLAVIGNITNPGASLNLFDPGNDITQTQGTVSTGVLNATAEDAYFTDANAIGTIGDLSVTGYAVVDGVGGIAGTAQAYYASFLSGGGFALGGTAAIGKALTIAAAGPLTQTGDVSAGVATFSGGGITLAGNDTITSRLDLLSTGDVAQPAGTLTIGALYLTANGNVTQSGDIATAGEAIVSGDGVTLSGSDAITGLLGLYSSGNVAQPGGSISASLLYLGASGNVTQSGDIAVAGRAAFSGDGITLAGNDGIGGVLNLTSAGDFAQPAGTISAGALYLTASGDATQSGDIAVAGSAALSADGITLAGNDAITGLLGVYATGDFAQPGGGIDAGLLNLAVKGAITQNGGLVADAATFSGAGITLSGNDAITGLLALRSDGDFAQPGGEIRAGQITLAASGALTQSGYINASQIDAAAGGPVTQSGSLVARDATLMGDGIILSGNDNISGLLDLLSTGNVYQTGGTIAAGTLAGTGATSASFGTPGGVAEISTLGSFILDDSDFILENTGSLVVFGPIDANIISLSATAQLTLDGSNDGGLFMVSQGKAPDYGNYRLTDQNLSGSLYSVLQAPEITTEDGFQFNVPIPATIADPQTHYFGTIFMITDAGGFAGGNISFNGAGLIGPEIDLVIDAGTAGKVSGNVNLHHLEIISADQVDLDGSIDGITGAAAAQDGTALPQPQTKYQFHSCPIGSVNCIILSIESLPTSNPLENFDISQRKRRRLDKNVQLPGIATHDF